MKYESCYNIRFIITLLLLKLLLLLSDFQVFAFKIIMSFSVPRVLWLENTISTERSDRTAFFIKILIAIMLSSFWKSSRPPSSMCHVCIHVRYIHTHTHTLMTKYWCNADRHVCVWQEMLRKKLKEEVNKCR